MHTYVHTYTHTIPAIANDTVVGIHTKTAAYIHTYIHTYIHIQTHTYTQTIPAIANNTDGVWMLYPAIENEYWQGLDVLEVCIYSIYVYIYTHI
jgi:hypothetical protein